MFLVLNVRTNIGKNNSSLCELGPPVSHTTTFFSVRWNEYHATTLTVYFHFEILYKPLQLGKITE